MTSAMRMGFDLREQVDDRIGAGRLAAGRYLQNLPDLEERPARHFHGKQVGADGGKRLGGLGRAGNYGASNAGDLVGDAADQSRIGAEGDAANVLAAAQLSGDLSGPGCSIACHSL